MANGPHPLPVSLRHFGQPPAAVQKIELLHTVRPHFELSIRCQHQAHMTTADCGACILGACDDGPEQGHKDNNG